VTDKQTKRPTALSQSKSDVSDFDHLVKSDVSDFDHLIAPNSGKPEFGGETAQ
jgi:hypothetical protein